MIDYLRDAYVYLRGCEAKCGNCGKPHKEHHALMGATCKEFRGWCDGDGCQACRKTLTERLEAATLRNAAPDPPARG